MVDVNALLKGHEKAKKYRDAFTDTWRDAGDYVRPVRDDIAITEESETTPNRRKFDALYDTTAREANITYAAGCMSWMTPSETNWFSFDPPEYLSDNDDVKSWYSVCTDETRRILAGSNFYSRIHEIYLDDGAFGTSAIAIEEDSRFGVRFEALPIGTYSILENNKREVDTVFRELKLTPKQAAEEFGEENLAKDVQEQLRANSDEKRLYLHISMPRSDADRIAGKIDGENLPWAVYYIDTKDKKLVRESGTWENRIPVHRHLLWGCGPYGIAPGVMVLPDARQLNAMQEYLDALVQKQVTPPVLLPERFKGKVNLNAGGHTFFKSDGEKPQFWQNPGNYLVGEDRVEFRRNQINRAFHVDLFQALASVPVGKEMTAAEIHMRQRDRLTLFSPTFGRKNTELNTPIMRCVFAILLRAGAFPDPPANLIQEGPDGLPFLPDPEINYTSRLSLQIKAIHNESLLRTMEMVGPMASVAPDMIDHLDLDSVTRGVARNEGVPESWLRPEREVAELREARAREQARIQMQLEVVEQAEAQAKLQKAG